MDIDECLRLSKQNPFLAIDFLSLWLEGDLESARLYRPESVVREYRKFCEKLQLKRRPYVLVMKPGGSNIGVYSALSNMVILSEEVFASFQSGKTEGQYVVAHELGHAKFAEKCTRRRFLEILTLSLGSSVAGYCAGAGVDWLWHPESNAQISPDKTKPEEENAPFLIMAPAAVTAYGYTALIINSLFVRAEEFQADQYAKEVLPVAKIAGALAGITETKMYESGYEDALNALKKEFRETVIKAEHEIGRPLSRHAQALGWALVLSENFSPKKSLKDILLHNYYPTTGERIKRITGPEKTETKGNAR